MEEEPRLVLAKPTEQSFAAYLAFIDSFYTGMTGKPVPERSEAEIEKLRADWRKFWHVEEEPTERKKPRRNLPRAVTNRSGG